MHVTGRAQQSDQRDRLRRVDGMPGLHREQQASRGGHVVNEDAMDSPALHRAGQCPEPAVRPDIEDRGGRPHPVELSRASDIALDRGDLVRAEHVPGHRARGHRDRRHRRSAECRCGREITGTGRGVRQRRDAEIEAESGARRGQGQQDEQQGGGHAEQHRPTLHERHPAIPSAVGPVRHRLAQPQPRREDRRRLVLRWVRRCTGWSRGENRKTSQPGTPRRGRVDRDPLVSAAISPSLGRVPPRCDPAATTLDDTEGDTQLASSVMQRTWTAPGCPACD